MANERLKDMIIKHEGLRLELYKCTAGKTTIGVGHNIEDRGISNAVADLMLREDIEMCVNQLHRLPWFGRLNRARQDALIDMCFNLGISRLMQFKKMLSAFAIEDHEEASAQAKDSAWFEQVGYRGVTIYRMIRDGKYQ